MKKSRIITLALIFIANLLLTPAIFSQQNVAILVTGKGADDTQKKAIGSILSQSIGDNERFNSIDYSTDFLAELGNKSGDEIRVDQLIDLGEKKGVEYIVAADVNNLYGKLYIVGKLIQVSAGKLLDQKEVSDEVSNMTQLTNISQRLAWALFGKKISLPLTPSHLALCVKKNGRYFYPTYQDWESLDPEERNKYSKVGVYIEGNGNPFVLALFDKTHGQNYEAANAPTKEEFEYICDILYDVNTIMLKYGGQGLEGYYWTSTHGPEGQSWRVNFAKKQMRLHNNSADYIVREKVNLY